MADTFERAVRGITLFERRAGRGAPVVVLHGGPGASHDYLLPGFDLLADRHELIYYDQRGGGQSPVGRDVPCGWREHVDDLEALRAVWGLEQLTLAGYSWGGLLAMLYATEYPERVARLALVSPAPSWRAARDEFERRFAERNLSGALQAERAALRASDLRTRDLEAYNRRLFELSVIPYFADPRRAHDLTPFRIVGRVQQEVWSSLGDFDLRPQLSALRVPALVLHGEADVIPIESARETARCLRAEFAPVPACGHVPFVEASTVFHRVVGAFLG